MSINEELRLRRQFADAIGLHTPEYVESIGMQGTNLPADRFEAILDKVMSLHQADREAAVRAALEQFRVFCYEKHAFEAFDTPAGNRQGWLDTKLREFTARLQPPTAGEGESV